VLTDFERDILVKLCQETSMAKSAHLSEHVLVHRFPNLGHRVRRALSKLISKGYVARHPTRNEMTYQLTDIGREECREMKEEALKSSIL
jgi:DNA-binding transcriptional regulator PaaX